MTLFDETADQQNDADPIEVLKQKGKYLNAEGEVDQAVLARAALEKDRFIAQLQGELSGLRGDLQERMNMKTFLDRMESLNQARPEQGVTQPPPEGGTQSASPKIEDIEAMFEKKLAEREKNLARQRNLDQAKDSLQKAFGTEYQARVKALANQMGVSPEFLEEVAAQSPQALVRLVGAEREAQGGTSNAPPKSSMSSGSLGNPGIKRNSYYEELAKRDPVKYHSKEIQNERWREAHSQGLDFFD